MKAKFKYIDLMIAGTIGAMIALAVHHEWRKNNAKAFISNIQKTDCNTSQNDLWKTIKSTEDDTDDLHDVEDVIDMNALKNDAAGGINSRKGDNSQ